MTADLTPRERVARAIRSVPVGPLGPNALAIVNQGGTTRLTPSEAQGMADAALTALADHPGLPDLTRQARDEAERRWSEPGRVNGLTYLSAEVRASQRGAFVTGAEWAHAALSVELAEAKALVARIAAVEALHRPDDHGPGRCDEPDCPTGCVECGDDWPCATRRALTGEGVRDDR